MKNLLYIFISVFILTIAVQAQPENPTRFPIQDSYSNNINSSIITLPNNNLAMFWFDSTNRQIKLSRSIDNGVSWSGESIVVSPNPNSNDIDINAVVLNSGRILLTFKLSSFYYIYSDDNAITWSVPAVLPTSSIPTVRLKSFLSSISKLSTNEVIFTFSISTTTDISNSKGIYYIKSGDGINWTSMDTIDNSGKNGYIFNTTTQKNIIVYQDSINSNKDLCYRTSIDAGVSWSDKNILISNSFTKLNPIGVTDLNGKLWVYYTEEDPTPFSNIFQSNINFITSTDDGTNWTTPENFTKYVGYDFNPSITTLNGRPLIAFASSRNFGYQNKFNQIYFTLSDVSIDENVPPFLYQFSYSSTDPYPNTPYFIKAFANDDEQINNIKLVTEVNYSGIYIIIDMHDDGLHNDSLANDKIYGASILPENFGETVTYYFMILDNDLNSVSFNGGIVSVPLVYASDTYFMDNNNIKLPMDNRGVLGDVNINNVHGGWFDESTFLFSGGMYLSGFNNGILWANGIASASLVEDYQAGPIGTEPTDPYNKLYIIKKTDPPFGSAWQVYSHAVDQGADYFDGNNDGTYNPVDLNGNNQWDLDEDRPDFIGDVTAWCVYNDGVPGNVRRWNQQPMGIEVQQTAFSWGDNVSIATANTIFIRYRLINKGNVNTIFDSVYFGCWADPDMGADAYSDDIVGCDIPLNFGFSYNYGSDNAYGINPPAFGIPFLQGPINFIPGETFADINGNGLYENGIDVPLDTAYLYKGPVLGIEQFPGAKNMEFNSFMQYINADPILSDPNNIQEVRNYMLGRTRFGEIINPCIWAYGEVRGGVDCSTIDPRFMYSGDPETNFGWLNDVAGDQRMLVNTGPFKLEVNKPIDIIVAYVIGRGTNSVNSVSVLKSNVQVIKQIYESNFVNIPVGVENIELPIAEFRLSQNYPNPFNPSTKISWQSPVSGYQTLKVYDVLGNEVATLVDEYKPAGMYNVQFTMNNLASGIYFYRLTAGTFVQTRKMILIK